MILLRRFYKTLCLFITFPTFSHKCASSVFFLSPLITHYNISTHKQSLRALGVLMAKATTHHCLSWASFCRDCCQRGKTSSPLSEIETDTFLTLMILFVLHLNMHTLAYIQAQLILLLKTPQHDALKKKSDNS